MSHDTTLFERKYLYFRENSRISFESIGSENALIIYNLQTDDAGMYECELIGAQGSSSKTSYNFTIASCLKLCQKIHKLSGKSETRSTTKLAYSSHTPTKSGKPIFI